MGFYLANYLKYQGWGPGSIVAGDMSQRPYITGISLTRNGENSGAVFKDRLLILSQDFCGQPHWPECLPPLQSKGVAALAYIKGELAGEARDRAVETCGRLNFPLLELPETTFIHDLLLQSEMLFSINEDGQAITTNEMLNLLRQVINTEKISGLLQVLHTWLDCRATLAIKHDIYAYPPLSGLEEAYADYNGWEHLPQSSLFPWIDIFYIPGQQTYDIRCQILYDGKPLGFLSLGRPGRPFDDKELKVADYAAVLCAGLNHTLVKSQRIQDLLAAAYQGNNCSSEDACLLPESGYALVLREIPAPLTRDDLNLEEENNFLGYLIHTAYGNGTYYAFLHNGDLALFCSTNDIKSYTKELLALLHKNKRVFRAGVSQRYSRQETGMAFAEAKHAVNLGQYLDEQQEVFFFHDMGIYRFFSYPENSWSVNQMLNEMTQKLDSVFDEEKKQVLTTTLTRLVKNNFNYSKTSEEMFTHPNTIRYRIRLLEELWEKDLSKDEDRLLISVVGKLLPLWQRYNSRA